MTPTTRITMTVKNNSYKVQNFMCMIYLPTFIFHDFYFCPVFNHIEGGDVRIPSPSFERGGTNAAPPGDGAKSPRTKSAT